MTSMKCCNPFIALGVVAIIANLAFISLLASQQPVFAVTPEKINLDLKIDVTTIKLSDLNNNTVPDPGEMVGVVGKLYNAGTQNEVGTYRCTFMWGGWSNSTEGTPVAIATQVFDMKGNGTIVVVGDEPGVGAEGKPVAGVIAGGTGGFIGISGIATLTDRGIQGNILSADVVLDFERSSNATSPTLPS